MTHRCDGCGYEAVVPGVPDAGMIADTLTMSCGRCRSIVDVVVGRRDLKRSVQPVAMCPDCGAHRGHLMHWTTGDPCPKCTEAMLDTPDGMVVMWD